LRKTDKRQPLPSAGLSTEGRQAYPTTDNPQPITDNR